LNINVEVVARTACVLSEEALLVGFINSALELDLLVPEFTSDVDISCLGSHTETDNESTLDKFVRIMTKDLSVLTGAWL
jgi:hypothetical protein